MINTDGERFTLYSSMGVPIQEIGSFIQVRSLIDREPTRVFDSSSSDDKARIEGIGTKFVFEFGPEVQPQDIRKAWNRYNNYPGF